MRKYDCKEPALAATWERIMALSIEGKANFLDFLVERGFIQGQHAETLQLLKQSRYFFGVLALRANYVTLEQLEEILKYQSATGTQMKIGEIMLKRKYMTQEQISKILDMQDTSSEYQADLILDVGFMTEDKLHEALIQYEDYKKIGV